ncbi:hypothetical protein N7456_000332 [Penicillium angulare]|uniref:Nephrocystin 3-like N-terminal domain-containing protein n=1 Tax=Penicillium angulare TaxID=116970 RepID=A0A9W9KS47_9EURO|nr:hypothetical protein N7456_000332 [Penicillium angulare]
MGGFRVLCCSKGDRNDDDHPAPPTPSVQSVQPRPETKTQKTPENVKADSNGKPVTKVESDSNVQPDSSSTDVMQEKQKTGPRDLWKEAYEDLDDGDKKYVPATGASSQVAVKGVIAETKSRYEEWKNGGLKIGGKNGQINIRDSAEKILNAAMKASGVISTIVSFDPIGHASSAWTVVSFGMSIVGNSLDRRDAIFAASEYLSDKLAYYALIDAHYRNQDVGSDDNLDQTLLDVYKAILCFTVDVKKAQNENAAVRASKSVFALTEQPLSQLKTAIEEQGAVAAKWTALASDLGNRKAAAAQLASIKSLESKILSEDEEKRVIWLSATDYSRRHRQLQETRTDDTGSWLLDSKEYIGWKDNSGGLLLLPGISGCGKSYLCSTIIEDIEKECESDNSKYLAYWYFEFSDSISQNVDSLTRSLIRQLSRSPLLPPVFDLFEDHKMKGGEPSSKKIKQVFKDTLAIVPGNIYLIFDALDECGENGSSEQRERLFELVNDLMGEHRNKLHILATSRPEQDIKDELEPLMTSTIDLEAHLAEDVKSFVVNTLNKHKFKRFSADMKELVKEKLLSSKERRFRWAGLQLDAIKDLHDDEDIKEALETIPQSLEESYMRILNGFGHANTPRARNILMTICTSPVALSLETVAAVVGLKSPESIIEICTTGLVSMFDGMVRVAHFSVQEFLIIPEGDPQKHHECQFSAMEGSRYLATRTVDCLLQQTTVLTRDAALKMPLFLHAARYWNGYVAALEDSDPLRSDLQPKLNRLFTEPEVYFNWDRGLESYHKDLLSYDETEIDHPPSRPIQIASRMGLAQTVEELLDRGADIETTGGCGFNPFPLCCASGQGHEAVVRILLNRGAMVNTDVEGPCSTTAIMEASQGGHEKIVQILLDHGAVDINTTFLVWRNYGSSTPYCSALEAASDIGYEGIVKLLVDASDRATSQETDGTGLAAACEQGHDNIVRFLVGRGVDMNIMSRDWQQSLICVLTIQGNESLVKFLLDHGGDPNASASNNWPRPLACAVNQGNERLVEILLNGGANLNPSISESAQSPLEAAASRGVISILQLLLDRGADINADDGQAGGAALAAAVRNGKFEAMQLLVDRGVDINQVDEDGYSALLTASNEGYEDSVRILLEKGADVNFHDKDGDIALQYASDNGSESMVQILLDAGAQVDWKGSMGSALQIAATKGHKDIVKLLLEKGADVNLHDTDDNIALQYASDNGFESIVQILLDAGAQIDSKGSMGSALQIAATKGHKDIVKLLLDRGADVNVEGGTVESLLEEAAKPHNESESDDDMGFGAFD